MSPRAPIPQPLEVWTIPGRGELPNNHDEIRVELWRDGSLSLERGDPSDLWPCEYIDVHKLDLETLRGYIDRAIAQRDSATATPEPGKEGPCDTT